MTKLKTCEGFVKLENNERYVVFSNFKVWEVTEDQKLSCNHECEVNLCAKCCSGKKTHVLFQTALGVVTVALSCICRSCVLPVSGQGVNQ